MKSYQEQYLKKKVMLILLLDVFFDSQPVPCTFTQAGKYVNRAE